MLVDRNQSRTRCLPFFSLGNPTRGGGGKDDDQQKRRQALSEIIAQSPTLSLLSFNLEPLTDTLEVLELSDNDLQGLPMQFQGRSFARLRALDLSHNSLKGITLNTHIWHRNAS